MPLDSLELKFLIYRHCGSLSAMAVKMKCTREYLSQVVNGNRTPSERFVKRLAKILKIQPGKITMPVRKAA